jgi:protein ImuB
VWLRRLTTDRLLRAGSPAPADAHVGGSRFAPSDTPLVVTEPVKGALRLAAVNDAADGLGLKPGMALADARAMYPRIAVADADPEADRRLLVAIADWCDRYTPLVGLDPPDGLFLDIAGCAHLFGGEETLRRDLVARLHAQGFQARAAVADTVGCAWAVARYGAELRVPSEQTREALLPLPLAALRIAPETVTALAQVGLKRIADAIDRPRAPLAARFGVAFVRRLDQAIGLEDEPIAPRLPVPAFVTERRFAEPIALEADVLGTIEHLAHELVKLMERRGEGARLIEVALFRTDGKVHRIAAGTGAPLRDAARIRALFVERLAAIGDECDPGFGYDVIRLGARATQRSDPAQTGLVGGDHAEELAHLVDRLGARFGLRRVTRLVPQDTHIPEYAVASVAAATAACPGRTATRSVAVQTRDPGFLHSENNRGPGSAVHRFASATRCHSASKTRVNALMASGTPAESTYEQDSLAPTRPIRLFERPERIKATAEVPDGAPIQFTWRQLTYHVINAEGPERIVMEWWRDDKGDVLTRDYFRVESKEGIRAWLFRRGPYASESTEPQWYLHGLFA